MFGQSNNGIEYLFSKLLDEPAEIPSPIPIEIQHDMVITKRFQIEHGPDDEIMPTHEFPIKLKEVISPASEKY